MEQSPRQQAGKLWDPRLEVIEDPQDVVRRRLHLIAHASHSGRAALQIRDAHDVVERHPRCEITRGLARRREAPRPRRVGRLLRGEDTQQPLAIEVGVALVLIVSQARPAERGHRLHGRWKRRVVPGALDTRARSSS